MQAELPFQLSNDLWAKILGEVSDGIGDRLYCGTCNMAKVQSRQHQLRLDCRKFNEVFDSHSELSRGLLIALKPHALPSLLAWLKRHGHAVQMLAACCHPTCMEAVLVELQPAQRLNRVYLSYCSTRAVQLLGGLTTLTCCELTSPPLGSIDLAPLASLASLRELHLADGAFVSVGLPAHLTNLTLTDCDLHGAALPDPLYESCATSLRKLHIITSELTNLQPSSLTACLALEELQCVRCSVADWDSPDNCIALEEGQDFSLPAAISTLTSVSYLTLGIASRADVDMVHMDQLNALTCIQDLFLESQSISICLSAGFSKLQRLTLLYLATATWVVDIVDPLHNELGFDWSAMHALQRLTIRGWHIKCTSSLLGLTTLSSLTAVAFDRSKPVQDVHVPDFDPSFKNFTLLVQRMSRYCPQVALSIE